MKIKPLLNSRVVFYQTSDRDLDGQRATVVGFVDEHCIVYFDQAPKYYYPAIVMPYVCLQPCNQ